MLAGGLYERRSGAAGQPLGGYRRRAPERSVLHELVAGHAQTLIAELREADPEEGGLPRYVERELAAYLRCGILAHGFTRVRCQACDDEIVVAFSCKRRGICPSCTARRMADTAAHLVDRVLPRAPYRQWVFTVPKPLRLVLARDPAWTSWIGGLVVRAIGAWQRRVARKRGIRAPLTGAVSLGIRVGTYGSQRAWISGSKRDAHHVLQVVFIKFLENQFTGAKPFSYLYNFPKAYKKLGIESSGGLATAIHGPGGDLRLDVKHFAGGTRADEMPTIFLSNFTHRARLHLVPDEGTMRRSLLSAFRGGNREELFKATLEDRKTLGKIRDTDDVDRAIDGAGDVSFTIKELREKVYEGARAAYRRAWEPEHQQKLRVGVYRHEPAYYNSVVKERLASDKPVTTPSKLEGAMTTAAVNAVIKAVDDLIGKDGFKPA